MLGQAERVLGVDLLYNLQEAIQKARPGFDVWVLDPYCLDVIIH